MESVLPLAQLEVMDDPVPRDGGMNMALDEILIGRLQDGALLRLYRWIEPTVSFGYFERVKAARQIAQGREIVRRWTGGGIVEHGDDLTYSLLIPRSSRLATLRGSESYRLIHDAIASGMNRLGFNTQPSGELPGEGHENGSRACFEKPVLYDLLVAGRKVAGAAQRRTRTGLLHQGSIQVFTAGGDSDRCLADRVGAMLPQVFGATIKPRRLAPAELSAANDLAASKYASMAWSEKF